MYKDNTQRTFERYMKLIPVVKVLILALHSWDEFKIPQKPMIYFLPTQQQQTLTYFLSNVKYHFKAIHTHLRKTEKGKEELVVLRGEHLRVHSTCIIPINVMLMK